MGDWPDSGAQENSRTHSQSYLQCPWLTGNNWCPQEQTDSQGSVQAGLQQGWRPALLPCFWSLNKTTSILISLTKSKLWPSFYLKLSLCPHSTEEQTQWCFLKNYPSGWMRSWQYFLQVASSPSNSPLSSSSSFQASLNPGPPGIRESNTWD